MQKKYKDYADYLKSDKWKQVKKDYTENNKHKYCALCGFDGELQHHHFRYPSDWNCDHHLNIIKICSECHKIAHTKERKNETVLDFIAYMSPLISESNQENGIVCGQDEVLSKILSADLVDVVKIQSLTDKNKRSAHHIKIGKELTTKCNFYPLGIWGSIIDGTK